MTDPPPTPGPSPDRLRELAASGGLRSIHIVAWRDRDDEAAGGSEEHAAQVATHWAEAGLDVTIRTSRAPDLPATASRDGYRVVRRGGQVTVFPRTILAELTRRDGHRDGLVDVFHGVPFFSPAWVRGPRIGVLHHVHLGTWHLLMPPGAAQLGHALERFAVPLVYRRATIVALSEATRTEAVERLHLRRADIRIARPGVDPRFTPGGERSPTPLVLTIGRLMPQKGFDLVLEAFARLHDHGRAFDAVVVGDGPSRQELEKMAAELGLADQVTFAGRVDDDELAEHYRRAWVVANGSKREGWGMTLTEAGACGTPGVATRIPGHDEAVVDGVTGLLVDDAESMALGLDRILGDPELRARYSDAAREHAVSNSWARCAELALTALVDDARRRGKRGS